MLACVTADWRSIKSAELTWAGLDDGRRHKQLFGRRRHVVKLAGIRPKPEPVFGAALLVCVFVYISDHAGPCDTRATFLASSRRGSLRREEPAEAVDGTGGNYFSPAASLADERISRL